MKKTIIVLATLIASNQCYANDIIRCVAGEKKIDIAFESYDFNGEKLNCLFGSFLSDMTPCAPNGGFAVSAPTGTAPIVYTTSRWQDVRDEIGGVTQHWINSTQIYFRFDIGQKKWEFIVDKIDGTGALRNHKIGSVGLEDFVSERYICQEQSPVIGSGNNDLV